MKFLRVATLALAFPLIAGGAICTATTPAESEKADDTPAVPKADLDESLGSVDVSKLSDAQRDSFFQLTNTQSSVCQETQSLAKSLGTDPDCKDSVVVGQLIADSLEGGVSVSDLRQGIPEMIDTLRPKEIDISDRPVFGNERAPVTIVVFADFQCPHCAQEAPELQKAVTQFRGQAKLVYRHFPLNMHASAKRASMATEAAYTQDKAKFWPMHNLIFENQVEVFDDEDEVDRKLRAYAESIGLDLAAYDTFMKENTGLARIDKDRKAGEDLKITGTPAVFVNGRYYSPMLFGGSIQGWIENALTR